MSKKCTKFVFHALKFFRFFSCCFFDFVSIFCCWMVVMTNLMMVLEVVGTLAQELELSAALKHQMLANLTSMIG